MHLLLAPAGAGIVLVEAGEIAVIALVERLVAQGLKVRLADLGNTALAGSPADLGKLMVEETEKWAKVTRAANIKPE